MGTPTGQRIVQIEEHRVEDGDSLEWLARKYSTTVSALKKLNNLHDDLIYTGSVLKISKPPKLRGFQLSNQKKLTARDANVSSDNRLSITASPSNAKSDLICPFNTTPVLRCAQRIRPLSKLNTVQVRFGDTLADIACKHGLSVQELQQLNNLRNDAIFVGDVLAVSSGLVESRIQDVRPGRRRTTRLLFSKPRRSIEGTCELDNLKPTLEKRGTADVKLQAFSGHWQKKKSSQYLQEGYLRLRSPLMNGFITSPFGCRWGSFHEGVDLAAEHGTPIFASESGTVMFAGWSSSYGYLLEIQHDCGFVTRYAHCCAVHAHVGQKVLQGQRLASVGSTGRSTGPHVHFEVRMYGEAQDPLKFVRL